jgi:hypothetical protein
MVSYASTRAFLDTYIESLRVLGNIINVDVVNVSVEHMFSDGLVGDVPLRDVGRGFRVKEKQKEREKEREGESAVEGEKPEGEGKKEKEGSPHPESPSDSDTLTAATAATLEAAIAIEKEEYMAEDLARTIWEGVEGGGVATIGWPRSKYIMYTAARGESVSFFEGISSLSLVIRLV